MLVEGNEQTAFLYAEANKYLVELPLKGGAPVVRRIWLGEQMLASVKGNQANYLMADALGSVVAQTGSSGTVIQRASYEPYGEASVRGVRAPSDERAGFVGVFGVQHDWLAGLDNMWFRYYDAEGGVFISVDPLLYSYDQCASGVFFSSVWLRYRYARNSPAGFNDPNGLFTWGAGETVCVGLALVAGAALTPGVGLGVAAVCGAMAGLDEVAMAMDVANNAANSVCRWVRKTTSAD
jgi:RHS repeat-associated protein